MKFKFLLSEQDTSELKDKDQTLYVINNYADNTKQKYANIDPQLIDKLRASDLGRGSIVNISDIGTASIVGSVSGNSMNIETALSEINTNSYDNLVLIINTAVFAKQQLSETRYNAIISDAKQQNMNVLVILTPSYKLQSYEFDKIKSWISNIIKSNIEIVNLSGPEYSHDDNNFNKNKTEYSLDLHEKIEQRVIKYLLSVNKKQRGDKRDKSEYELADDDVRNMSVDKMEFINNILPAAEESYLKYGIPVSITLAQSILESGWGKSKLAYKYNNYFGITGTGGGKNFVILRDSGGKLLKFRTYDSVEQSVKDHSDLLHRKYTPKNPKSYVEWANSLQKLGYAESTTYADTLIRLIQSSKLDKYDVSDNKQPDTPLKLKKIIGQDLIVTSDYGPRSSGMHYGTDFRASVGTKIYIAKPGVVERTGNWNPTGWGNTIIIQHEDGVYTLYAHLSSIAVRDGDKIKANMYIGSTGGEENSPGAGNSKDPHLHWEYHPGSFTDNTTARDGESVADEYFKLV